VVTDPARPAKAIFRRLAVDRPPATWYECRSKFDHLGGFGMRPATIRAFATVGRGFALVSAWLTAVVVASTGYAAGSFGFVPAFAGPFGVAVAVAVAVAWAVEGKRRRSADFLASLGVFLLGMASLIPLLLWTFRVKICIRLGIPYQAYWSIYVFELTRLAWMAGYSLVGAIPGLAAGLIAGGLLVLARRRPRPAAAVAAGLVLAAGAFTPAILVEATRLLLVWRSEGGQWNAASVNEGELAMMLGAFSGSVVGAILAGLTGRIWPGRRTERATSAASKPN